MLTRLRLRPEIPDDIESIARYLDPSGGEIAQRFTNAVFVAFDNLQAMPGLGSPKPGGKLRGSHLRSWFVPGFRNYLILYRRFEDHILVIAVLHGARNLPRILRKRR